MLVLSFFKYKRKFYKNTILRCFCNKSNGKINVLYFGTDDFSLPSLKIIHEEKKNINSKINSLEVVTSFKNPMNRVRKFAIDNNITLHKWPLDKNFYTNIHSNFDIGIVVSFGYLLPSKLIFNFPMGMINLHASLLPKWRGAAPIVHALANGDEKTGITIMKVEPKHFDIGDILYQEEVLIPYKMMMPDLYRLLSERGAKLILKTLSNLPQCLQQFKKQDETLASYAPKVTADMATVCFKSMEAKDIYNLYRALYGYKNLLTSFNKLHIKLVEIEYEESYIMNEKSNNFGFIKFSKDDESLIVLCKKFTYVKIKKLKVEGKKVMTATEFNNGYLKKCNEDQRYFS